MAHRTLQDARALLELQDHLDAILEAEQDLAQAAQCQDLRRDMEAAKSMVASRDMLAAQWGLGVLLGEQEEFSVMRAAHDMLNARVRKALQDINSSVKALLDGTAPGPEHGCPAPLPDPPHPPQPEPLIPM
eukprot:12912029-Prorocentrum_lima.AAC.1